jgi:hypothetical protein
MARTVPEALTVRVTLQCDMCPEAYTTWFDKRNTLHFTCRVPGCGLALLCGQGGNSDGPVAHYGADGTVTHSL